MRKSLILLDKESLDLLYSKGIIDIMAGRKSRFSAWVREKIKEEFGGIESLEETWDNFCKQIRLLEDKKNEIDQEIRDIKIKQEELNTKILEGKRLERKINSLNLNQKQVILLQNCNIQINQGDSLIKQFDHFRENAKLQITLFKFKEMLSQINEKGVSNGVNN